MKGVSNDPETGETIKEVRGHWKMGQLHGPVEHKYTRNGNGTLFIGYYKDGDQHAGRVHTIFDYKVGECTFLGRYLMDIQVPMTEVQYRVYEQALEKEF